MPLLPREERWRKLLIINYCACNCNGYGFYISLNVPNGVAAVRACAETCYVVCRCLIDDNVIAGSIGVDFDCCLAVYCA